MLRGKNVKFYIYQTHAKINGNLIVNLFVEKKLLQKQRNRLFIRWYINIMKTTFYSSFIVRKLSFLLQVYKYLKRSCFN